MKLQSDQGGPLLQYVNGRAVLIGLIWGDLTYSPGQYACVHDNRSVMAFVRISAKIDWILFEAEKINNMIQNPNAPDSTY